MEIAPAQIQTYYNPTIDLFFYSLVHYLNERPTLIAFSMGAFHGINVFFIISIAREVFRAPHTSNSIFTWLLLTIAVVIGITGANGISLIGLTTNDPQISILVLAALLLILKLRYERTPSEAKWLEGTVGFLTGLAVALKLVVVTYALGIGVTYVFITYRHVLKALARFTAGALAGFIVGGGWFFWLLYSIYANPVFPLFNGIFRSPYFTAENIRDERFLPKTLNEWFFYPFHWAETTSGMVTELTFRDPRIALAFSLVAVAVCSASFGPVLHKLRKDASRFEERPIMSNSAFFILCLFYLISYVAWLLEFSMYRYLRHRNALWHLDRRRGVVFDPRSCSSGGCVYRMRRLLRPCNNPPRMGPRADRRALHRRSRAPSSP